MRLAPFSCLLPRPPPGKTAPMLQSVVMFRYPVRPIESAPGNLYSRYDKGAVYPMIRIRLSTILGKKRWPQKKLADKAGVRSATVNLYYNELIKQVSLDVLDKFCKALDCQVADLLEYVPDGTDNQ